MRRKEKLPELLAPAGSFECLLAAVEGGADAVYVGGKRFGARAYAKNFDIEELRRAVSYCHLHGVKVYVTANVLFEDGELAELVEYATELYNLGVDALIMADLGAIAEVRRNLPQMEIHASTQMSVHNLYGANAAAGLGCSRVVLARELPLSDIRSITEAAEAEVEVFLHGALCVCHSGQCLFSSLVGGRSGNRGECAQPCRLPYNGGKYPLSLKDLSLANHIKELVAAGVSSLKIEGRMKSPDYVYTVVSTYRRLLDCERDATTAEHEQLRRAFSRGGFTDGYLTGELRSSMTGVRSEEDKQQSREASGRVFEPRRVAVRASARIVLGEPSEMRISDGNREITVTGETPAVAERAPLSDEAVRQRLAKMGNTFLSLRPEDIDLTLEEGVNMSPAAINALRRSAAEAFESTERKAVRAEYRQQPTSPYMGSVDGLFDKPIVSAVFLREGELVSALGMSPELLSGLDMVFLPITSSESSLSLVNGVYMPPVIFEGEIETLRQMLQKAKNAGIMYALVGNIGHLALVSEYGLTPVGDFRLNVTNRVSRSVYEAMGVKRMLLSPELTLPKARDVGGGVITLGRIPLMITERCFIRENFTCSGCESAYFTDRRGERFPLMREFEHRNLILNSTLTYMGDRKEELRKYRIRHTHLLFTVERPREIIDYLSAYKADKSLSCPVRRVGRREAVKK